MAGETKAPAAVYLGLMADLGRSRQDELPLSHEQRHCTYEPLALRTRYKKVSVENAKAASTLWSKCVIKDEETEQMEGLELSECPWRPNKPSPSTSARHHDLLSDKPRKASAPSRPLQDNTISFAPVNKEVQKKPEPEKKSQPVEQANTKQEGSANCDQEPTVGNDDNPGEVSLTTCVFQNGELFNGEANPIAYFGTFMNYPGSGGPESCFLVEFEIEVKVKVQESPASAFLHLRARGRGSRKHDISLLDTPQMASQFCVLTTKSGPAAKYFLKFENLEATKLFSECVRNTQKWLAYTANDIPEVESTTSLAIESEMSPAAKPETDTTLSTGKPEVLAPVKPDAGETLSVGKPEVIPTAKPNKDEVKAKNNPQHQARKESHLKQLINKAENESEALLKADQGAEQNTNGVAERKEASYTSEEATCLINIAESLTPNTLEKKVSNSTARTGTEKAFDGLWEAAGALFSTMVSAGEGQRKQLHAEIEEALDGKWQENKIPEAYSQVKDAFLTNLHSFIDMRFDLISQVIQMANHSTSQHVPESMKEFLKPICYKAEDLEHLRPKTTNCPEDIKKASFLPGKGAAKAVSSPRGESYFANREAPDLSTVSKLWSTAPPLKENQPLTQSAATTSANHGPAGQRASQEPEVPGSSKVVSPPQATKVRLPPRGLGSSMYATK
ncbi:unnamed protein product [Clonostachys rosea]|uniref:Uncharacterized protein n=1 Tax=Bionectria ochroleuca TaxID=29856 RepID=A0ABY6TT69_BIOOC|nr:unnamed protein product [Clonostachys rosea]